MRPLLPNAVLLNLCAKTSLRAKWRFLRLARKCQPSVTESTLFWLFSSQQELVMHTQKPG